MTNVIRVALFDNIFWNNNSEAYPTTCPDLSLFKVYERPTYPVFHSVYEGTVILEGEFNMAFYEGHYYQLRKIRLDDKARGIIKYQMIFDIMLNFLNIGGTIKGNIIRTNNEEWLSPQDIIQTTIPLLENPAKCIYGKFDDINFEWQKNCKVLYPHIGEFIEHGFTERSFNYFWDNLVVNENIKAIKNKQWYTLDTQVYILSYLPVTKVKSWKNNVIKLIKEQLSDLKNYRIATASQLGDSSLRSHKCLTHVNAAIGTTESSNVGIKTVDLSALTDIKPLTLALTPEEPHQKISFDLLYRDDFWIPHISDSFIRKFSRVTHLPMKNGRDDIEDEAYLPLPKGQGYDDFYFKNTETSGYISNRPQKLKFKGHINTNVYGYLWKVDKLDFAFCGKFVHWNLPYGRSFPVDQAGDSHHKYIFRQLPRNKLPQVGFLIYEPKFAWNERDGFYYTSKVTRNTIRFRTGINKTLIQKYGDVRGKWYENAGTWLASIRGMQELTFHSLETDWFTWLYFAPKPQGANYSYAYQYYNDWNIKNVIRYIHYTPDLVLADIKGRSELNPFNEQRISNWLYKRDQLIDEISIYTDIKLKYPIAENDIFATSLNAKITSLKPPAGKYAAEVALDTWIGINTLGIFPLVYSMGGGYFLTDAKNAENTFMLVVDDLFVPSYEVSDFMADTLVVYTSHGKLKLGVYREYKQEIELDKSPAQIIETVNGKNKELITIYHIQDLTDPLSEIHLNAAFTQEQKDYMLNKALEATGIGKNGNMMVFTEEILKTTTQLFDLVGTDWYAYFKSGYVHLISKSEKDFYTSPPKIHTLTFASDHNLTTLEKINQKAVISIYGNSKNVATKFTGKKDEFDIHTEIFDIKGKESSVDYLQILSENAHDYINEIIEIPKKTLKATASISIAELENIKHQIRTQNQEAYINKAINENLYKQQMREFTRRREDLQYQIASEALGSIGTGLSVAALGGTPLVHLGTAGLSTALFKPPADAKKPLSLARHSFWTGRYGSGLAMAGTRFLQSIPSLVKGGAEFSRITEDEKAFIEKTSLEMYLRDTKHSNQYTKLVADLNRTSTSYVKREVNDRDLIDKLKEQGKPEIHLQLFVPTAIQLKKAKAIFAIYGVACYIEDKEILITNGMNPQTVQFDILTTESVSSELTSDLYLNESIRSIFSQGVIFLKHTYTPIHQETIEIIHPKHEEFDFDLSRINQWSSEEWDRYLVTGSAKDIQNTIKKLKNYGLTDEEYRQHKNEIDPNNPYEAVNKIIHNRNTGIQVIIRPKTQSEEEIEKLKKEIETLKSNCGTSSKNFEEQIKTLTNNLQAATTRAETLSKSYKNKEAELTQCTNLVNLYKAEADKFKKQAEALKTDYVSTANAHHEAQKQLNTCKLAKTELEKTLEAKTKELETKNKELQAEREKYEAAIPALVRVNRINSNRWTLYAVYDTHFRNYKLYPSYFNTGMYLISQAIYYIHPNYSLFKLFKSDFRRKMGNTSTEYIDFIEKMWNNQVNKNDFPDIVPPNFLSLSKYQNRSYGYKLAFMAELESMNPAMVANDYLYICGCFDQIFNMLFLPNNGKILYCEIKNKNITGFNDCIENFIAEAGRYLMFCGWKHPIMEPYNWNRRASEKANIYIPNYKLNKPNCPAKRELRPEVEDAINAALKKVMGG